MNLPALPQRILFVGSGFISFEFAHIAARAGSVPDILDRRPRPLKEFDPDLVELLVKFLGLAMRLDLTSRQLRSMTAAYPTAGSDLGSIL